MCSFSLLIIDVTDADIHWNTDDLSAGCTEPLAHRLCQSIQFLYLTSNYQRNKWNEHIYLFQKYRDFGHCMILNDKLNSTEMLKWEQTDYLISRFRVISSSNQSIYLFLHHSTVTCLSIDISVIRQTP
jgi:hypothetical protein